MKFFGGMVENNFEKRENAVYQHFLPFPKLFSKASLIGVLEKSELCDKKLIIIERIRCHLSTDFFSGRENIVQKGENACYQGH